MGYLRIRNRNPSNKNKGITYVHSEKISVVLKRIKIYKILLTVSVLLNIYLLLK